MRLIKLTKTKLCECGVFSNSALSSGGQVKKNELSIFISWKEGKDYFRL